MENMTIQDLLSGKTIAFKTEEEAKAFMAALRSMFEASQSETSDEESEQCNNIVLFNEIISLLQKRFKTQGSHSFRLEMPGFDDKEILVSFYRNDDDNYQHYTLKFDDYCIEFSSIQEPQYKITIDYKSEEFEKIASTGCELHNMLHVLLESLENKWIEDEDGSLYEKVS